MEYTITIYKKQSEPLYVLWIDMPNVDPQPGTVWQVVQRFVVRTGALPDALCGRLLMSEVTSDKLFRQIADTWLGAADDDPLNDYDRYASLEKTADSLDEVYLDRLEGE